MTKGRPPMSDTQVRRVTAGAGCVAFVLYLVSALLILDAPRIDSAPGVLAAYTVAHRTSFLLEVILWGPITCAVVAFAVGVWARLRQAEGAPGLFAALFLSAMLVTQTLVLGGFAALLVLGYRA